MNHLQKHQIGCDSALVSGKKIMVQPHGKDMYRRAIVDVLLSNGTEGNLDLVKEDCCLTLYLRFL